MTTGVPTGPAGRDVGHPPRRERTRGQAPRKRRRKPKNGPWMRRARLLLFALTPLLILVALGILVTYTRLLQGPISLARIAAPIERSISDSLGALTAKVDDVALVLTEDYGFEFRLINLTLSDSTGARVASAPIASASLSAGALLSGEIVPSRVYLIDPELIVTYREATGVSLQVASKLIEKPALLAEGNAATEQLVDGGQAQRLDSSRSAGTSAPTSSPQRVDIAKVVSELTTRARVGMGNNSRLKEIGVRNAAVTLDYEGQRTEWLIAEAAVDLNHDRNNTISGAARVQSDQGPWVFSFHTVESEQDNVVRLTLSVRDLVPSSIARATPSLSLLKTIEMPVALDAAMQVTNKGDMEAATLAIELAPGQVHLPSISGTPLKFDRCVFNLSYDGYQKRITVSPSTLRWADSFLTIAGDIVPRVDNGVRADDWVYKLASVDGQLAAEEFGIDGVKIESWQTQGSVSPAQGKLNIETFRLTAAGVEIGGHGELLAGVSQTSTRIDANLVTEDLKLLTAVWPRAFAPEARTWFGRNVEKGFVRSGTLKVVSGAYMANEAPIGTPNQQRVSLALEVGDLAIRHPHALAPAHAERALLRLENEVLEVTVPNVVIAGGNSGDIAIKTIRLSVVDLFRTNLLAEIAFKVRAPVKSVVDFAHRVKPQLLSQMAEATSSVRGLVDGDFKLQVALNDSVRGPVKIVNGEAKVKDLRLDKKLGEYSVRGGAFDVDISNDAVAASGDILINGVGAKLKLQHILGGDIETQPAVRITTNLDVADRDQLKIDINDIVAGEMPVEIQLKLRRQGLPSIHVVSDLTGADLLFADVAWRKPSGRRMRVEFDVVADNSERIELQNVQAVGQGIAIEGWAALDKNNILREFYFPDFSIDTVTRLRLQGKQSDKRIWSVKAIGPTYDGRTFFGSLFSLVDLSNDRPKARDPSKGMDLDAQIENVVGSGNETLRQVRLKVSHRAGKLVGLDGKAQLNNGKEVAVLLKRDKPTRTIYVESSDAGKLFKLIDFYPNMVGGRGRLELDLDGAGAASQTGILWAENFRILGDAVASEVFAGAEGGKTKRKVTRQVFDFTRLKMPFSVGHDQFVIQKSYLRGPALGASVSGKVDYGVRRVSLGGSYIPLQGINSALCGIPLLGEIITGPKCEGVLGITFLVQGSMSNPQVIVNPLSIAAPGIFREIFQMTNPSPRVTPRKQGRSNIPVEQRVRASSSTSSGAQRRQGAAKKSNGATAIDGWSSGTRATP